jgi:hypothetical protein
VSKNAKIIVSTRRIIPDNYNLFKIQRNVGKTLCIFDEKRLIKYLSHQFPIQNGLKSEDTLSLFLLKFALEQATKKVQESQKGLELNAIRKLNTTNKKAEILLGASNIGIKINVEETNYVLMSFQQNTENIIQ